MGLPYGDLLREEQERLAGAGPRAAARFLASAALGAALSSTAEAPPRPAVLGVPVDNMTIADALDAILAPPPPDRARVVHFVHPHALNLATHDDRLRAQLLRADRVLPDGVGLRVASLILGFSLRDNLNGTDLLPLLCERASREGRPLALVGAAPGVAEACAARLQEAHPGLQIPVVHHGFLGEEEVPALAHRLQELERPLVLVAMGSPRQEDWIWRHLAHLPGVTALSVGGLFDFFSGRIERAPWAWRELGLEWAFRLSREPRRLARRYLLGNPLFVLRVSGQRLREQVASALQKPPA
jgi:N-acetylglucosaminyldiphosphoundecaprenol N-acetyl-beta-D-mannosaminyltransferase